jgi:hypothetical protein
MTTRSAGPKVSRSAAYVACRKNRDVQSSRAAGSNSRIERSHRNLAEDMLNNPR